jgi:vancomycin resistance protein YoaR
VQRQVRHGLILLAVPAVMLLLTVSAWAIDSAATSGEVPRNTELAGHDIGTLSGTELRTEIAEVAEGLADRAVVIETPGGTLETTAGEVGLTLDPEAVMHDAVHVTEDDTVVLRPFSWLASFGAPHSVPLTYAVDADALSAGTAGIQAANRADALEPSIRLTDAGFEAVPGRAGQTLDLDALADDLVAAASGSGTGTVRVQADAVSMPPRFSDQEAADLAAEAEALSSEPITVVVGGSTATIEPATLRTWLTTSATDTGFSLSIDQAKIEAELPGIIGDVGTRATEVTMTRNDDGTFTANPGSPGTRCCAPDSVAKVMESLQSGNRTVELGLIEEPPTHDTTWAESLGIVEEISSFTTNHACCEARVQNIHRISDLIRGTIIGPGETLSINDTVGRRSEANGFVAAPVIYNGKMERDYGGGVSQFATTLFNASFYGGLEFGEYQSHSLYISRYPYGVEATLSYPHPDLQIKNPSPYGVLVWPTYTDTSVTITLYSTRWATGEKAGQYETREGNCKRVTTERVRTFTDGHTETDSVFAVYRPGEGVNC